MRYPKKKPFSEKAAAICNASFKRFGFVVIPVRKTSGRDIPAEYIGTATTEYGGHDVGFAMRWYSRATQKQWEAQKKLLDQFTVGIPDMTHPDDWVLMKIVKAETI